MGTPSDRIEQLSPVKRALLEVRDMRAKLDAYAKRMAYELFFAHVAPDGTDVRARLKAASYRYQSAGENLGMASGPLAAHFGIEHSPGHRRNLMEPCYTVAGVGTRDAAFVYLLRASGHAFDEGAVVAGTLGYAAFGTWLLAIVGIPFTVRLLLRARRS